MSVLLLVAVATAAPCATCEPDGVEKVGSGHRTIHSEVVIDAPPEAVWDVLTDWDRLQEWSPTILGIEGEIADGSAVTVAYTHPGNGKRLAVPHTLIYADGVQFGWSDPFLGKTTDHHLYRVEGLPDGRTRFVQDDEVKGGMMGRLFGGRIAKLLLASYQAFNQDLKTRVEERGSR